MSNNKLILIVDDELPIREMISYALTPAGFSSLHANNAEQAMSLIKKELPDLILMDWMLPGISGLELSRSLRHYKRTRNIPILMLSARTEDEDRLDGFKAGVDDYMTKPFSTHELIKRIKILLGNH
jgi:two-component system phosphate regulon response regulator PhoB